MLSDRNIPQQDIETGIIEQHEINSNLELTNSNDYYTYNIHSNQDSNSEQTVIESWTYAKEELILSWRRGILKDADIHERASSKFKVKHNRENNIGMILPLIMTVIQLILAYFGIVTDNIVIYTDQKIVVNNTLINSSINNSQYSRISILVGGIGSIVQAYIQHRNNSNKSGQNYVENSQYSSRYSDIVTKIDSELAKTKNFRTIADLFIAEIRYNISNLKNNAPPLC